jgi:hypothetical protein
VSHQPACLGQDAQADQAALLPGTIANDFRLKTATSDTGGRDETKLNLKSSWGDKLLLAPEAGEFLISVKTMNPGGGGSSLKSQWSRRFSITSRSHLHRTRLSRIHRSRGYHHSPIRLVPSISFPSCTAPQPGCGIHPWAGAMSSRMRGINMVCRIECLTRAGHRGA